MQAARILGTHSIVRAIAGAAERLARSHTAVAIVGEPGTGKELFARYLHLAAARPDERFVRIDCTEAVEQHLQQDLFERGGGWRRANGGTLLLDGLPSLAIEWQRRLHDELAAAEPSAWPHVVASMDRELAPSRRGGYLHEHLVELLRPVEVFLPALRQRRADIPVLVQHFLRVYAARNDVPVPGIETEALVQLWQYEWPGNVRELESIVERVVVLCTSGVIRVADLPMNVRAAARRHLGDRYAATARDAVHLRETL
jgi:two-component system response regulator HydG